jgi:hypothetical protein
MQVQLLNGVYVDNTPDFRTSYPVNMMPVPKSTGIAEGYLRPAEGLLSWAFGIGPDRGAINWNGLHYRVSGTKLIRINADQTTNVLGDVGGGGQVTFDYSFDVLAIASAGRLWYWDGSTLTFVGDPDIGNVVDVKWISGYFMTTDGTNLVVTELNDRYSVNPLKYGSSEADPDPVLAVSELRNEAYAFNRYTIEAFQNVGGDLFPFQRVEGAQVPRGVIGTHAYCDFMDTFAFVGGGRNEPPGVYLMTAANTEKLSTREIDVILEQFTEAELTTTVVESRVSKNHELLYIHLPDRALVFDAAASKAVGEPVWVILSSGLDTLSTYRARNFVWVYDGWFAGDPTAPLGVVCELRTDFSYHYNQEIGWEFGTMIAYAGGNDAIILEMELVCLPGRILAGQDPTVWTSYSLDGETWSQERPKQLGQQGQRNKRVAWRNQGTIRNYRMQKFRGTSQGHVPMARLEIAIEPLKTRPGNG